MCLNEQLNKKKERKKEKRHTQYTQHTHKKTQRVKKTKQQNIQTLTNKKPSQKQPSQTKTHKCIVIIVLHGASLIFLLVLNF